MTTALTVSLLITIFWVYELHGRLDELEKRMEARSQISETVMTYEKHGSRGAMDAGGNYPKE